MATKVTGRRLKPGADYHSLRSEAEYGVDCTCGFSTDVPGVDSVEAAEAAIRERHRCKDGVLTGYAYACEACGCTCAHGDLIAIKNAGSHVWVCDRCRRDIALGRLGVGAGRP